MRVLFCLLILLAQATEVLAQPEEWKKLRLQSQAVRYDDPVFALFKLQKAWDILARQSPKFATEVLRKDLQLTYSELNPAAGERFAKQSAEEITELMQDKINIAEWETWKVSRRADALLLSAPASHFDHRGACLRAALSAEEAAKKDPQKRKELDAMRARELAELKAKVALLPIVISVNDKKYSDVFALSKPLAMGQTKAVKFDLNPFLPAQFQSLKYPR